MDQSKRARAWVIREIVLNFGSVVICTFGTKAGENYAAVSCLLLCILFLKVRQIFKVINKRIHEWKVDVATHFLEILIHREKCVHSQNGLASIKTIIKKR